jgi:hypothetical protein
MVDIAKLKVGDKVYYQPEHYKNILVLDNTTEETVTEKWENGLVKEIPDWSTDSVRVVYNCCGDWNNYKDYTSALTNVSDLYLGWKS